jgi:hypothetical protein
MVGDVGNDGPEYRDYGSQLAQREVDLQKLRQEEAHMLSGAKAPPREPGSGLLLLYSAHHLAIK